MDRNTLQNIAFYFVGKASWHAIDKDKASDDVGDDWVEIWFNASIGGSSVFYKACELNNDPLHGNVYAKLAALPQFHMLSLKFGHVKLVRLDVTSCPWSLSKDVSWYTRSCKLAFSTPVLANGVKYRSIKTFTKYVVENIFFVHIFTI